MTSCRGQCESALYDAEVALERAIDATSYVASQCRADIESKCADIQPGGGRIAQCLADNNSSLSRPCSQVLTDVSAMWVDSMPCRSAGKRRSSWKGEQSHG